MKKIKTLLAAMLGAGLALSGCTFEEGLETAKNWMNESIIDPTAGFIDNIFPKKDDQEEKPEKEQSGDDDQGGGGEIIPEATLESISVSGQFKQNYELGEEFDSTGIVVTAVYSDQSTKDVSSEATFSGFSSESKGEVEITVSFEDKTDSFVVSIDKTQWTSEEAAVFADHLHGIVLPFLNIDGAKPFYDEEEDNVRIFNENKESLLASGDDVPNFAALFSAEDGWEDVSSDYGAYSSAPAGSFWVFERSAQTEEGMRRISVQFFGHDGDNYALEGSFYLFASDPFNYEFPLEDILAEFDKYEFTPFDIPAPDAEDMYFEFYPDSNNSLYYAFGYEAYMNATIYYYGFTQETFNDYVAKLEAAGWQFESEEHNGVTVYSGTLEIENVGIATIEQFYFTPTYSSLNYDYLISAPAEWPAEAAAQLVQKFAPGSTTVVPECPNGTSYDAYMSNNYNEIDVGGEESLKDSYAQILRDAGWNETEEGSYIFISPAEDIQITLQFTSYGLEIRFAGYIPPAAEWPAEDAASLLPEGAQDSLPPFEGAESYQYYSDNYGSGITCFVGEGNEESAMETYGGLLIEAGFILGEDGYYRSAHDEFKVELWKGTDGAFNIEVSIIAHWPTDDLATMLQSLVPGAKDSFPAMQGAVKYTLTDKTTSVRLALSYSTSAESKAAQTDYIALLVEAGFTYGGVDQYGDPYYNSPNSEFNINPWVSSTALILDIYPGVFEQLPSGLPTDSVDEILKGVNPDLKDSVPGYDIDGIFNVDDSGYYALIELGLACNSSAEASAHVTAYSDILVEAGYTVYKSGSYGGSVYISENSEILVYPYVYGSVFYIDIDLAA